MRKTMHGLLQEKQAQKNKTQGSSSRASTSNMTISQQASSKQSSHPSALLGKPKHRQGRPVGADVSDISEEGSDAAKEENSKDGEADGDGSKSKI